MCRDTRNDPGVTEPAHAEFPPEFPVREETLGIFPLHLQFLAEHEVFFAACSPPGTSIFLWSYLGLDPAGMEQSKCNDSKFYPSKIISQPPLNPSFTLFEEKGEMGFKEKEAVSAI